MARPAYKPAGTFGTRYVPQRKTITPVLQPVKFKKEQKNKEHPLKKLFNFLFALVLVTYVFPDLYNSYTKPLFLGPQNKSVNVDYQYLYQPTTKYLYNDTFLNVNTLKSAETKNPQMQTFYNAGEMPNLTARLTNLMSVYPSVKPSVFVWDFQTGKSVDIRATEMYPAASIIKIPVLLELFRSLEAGQISLYDKIMLTDYYKAGGSGSLQFAREGNQYSLNELAKVMIRDSDNSATNMIMSTLGGMPDVNNAVRRWGLKTTSVHTWLPDLGGTNVTSAKDIATMLYNIDNSSFLSIKSREAIIDYMSHVKNNRLLQAGLPSDAILIHKTGDIGTMLGDAGIVWTPQGRKYIVVILAKRPYNSPLGKDFIVKASSTIYDSISKNIL